MTSYLQEHNFADSMERFVEPNWNRGTFGTFTGARGLKLRYAHIPAEKPCASLVILHGQGECIEKYKEMALDCNRRGFSVYLFDQRGHGGSEGDLSIHRSTHIEDFSDYVDDLHTFIDEVIPAEEHGTLTLFAHSMGGAIATGFLQRFPGYFSRAVLHAPMLGINPPIICDRITRTMVGLLGNLPVIRNLRAPGGRKLEHRKDFLRLETTHSSERFSYHHAFLVAHPELATDPASVTFRFGTEAYRFLDTIMDAEKIKQIEIPLLLIQAEEDSYVCKKSQDFFVQQAQNCQLELITHDDFPPYHELYSEVDAVRSRVLDHTFDFLSKSVLKH